MSKEQDIFRTEDLQSSKPTTRSPLTEIPDFRHFEVHSSPEKKRCATNYTIPGNNYDENNNAKFELMNIKIVVYGLSGLICEQQEEKKKQKFGKGIISSTAMGMARRDMKPIGHSHATSSQNQTEGITTAVVSCEKSGTNSKISFETYLPSLPLGNPIATNLYKVRYAAVWPSEQSVLQQDECSKDRSTFTFTRCMKESSFIPGVGARSNYCHETIELGINLNRGTELIRLGTATIVVNGEEEGEVQMNVPATPFIFKTKKLKKKKNKYGYFSNDSSRRFSLDNNSVLKVGVQVIPEHAMRFAKEKEKTKERRDNNLHELFEQDKLKTLLQELGNENLALDRKQSKISTIVRGLTVDGVDGATPPEHSGGSKSLFPYLLCGSVPTSWVPDFLKRCETEKDVPTEIIADDNDIDQMVIRSMISSVSEDTDDLDIIEGKSITAIKVQISS